MGEYISREAVEQIIAAQCGECADACLEFDGIQPDCNQCLLYGAKKVIESIPAADVRPVVRGKWEPDYDYAEYDFDGSTPLIEPRKFQDGWKCSSCGGYTPSETSFCPNCGADMRPEPPKEG